MFSLVFTENLIPEALESLGENIESHREEMLMEGAEEFSIALSENAPLWRGGLTESIGTTSNWIIVGNALNMMVTGRDVPEKELWQEFQSPKTDYAVFQELGTPTGLTPRPKHLHFTRNTLQSQEGQDLYVLGVLTVVKSLIK